jgi:hypothetical protein
MIGVTMRKRRMLLAGSIAFAALGASVVVAVSANAATTSYEAEKSGNTIAGGARIANCGACSGGKKVGFVGNNAGTLTFNGVTATAAGSATLTITYASGNARSAQLSVNGGAAKTLNFTPTGSFNTPGTLITTVTLKAGSNTLKFGNTAAFAPDFDKIAVDTGGGTPPPPPPPPPPGGGGPSAAELLAKVTSCNQISHGKYKTDSDAGSATVAVCDKNGAVFWKADMDIDCDGQVTPGVCDPQHDCCFQPDTAFHQDGDGKPLISARLPYVVVPSESNIWRFSDSGVQGGSVVAVIFNNQVEYAVVGDTGPTGIIGEASHKTAEDLGIPPSAENGGVDSGVTYIVFKNSRVRPIESHGAAVTLGQQRAQQFINDN